MAYIDQEVRRLVGKALHQYRLIEDGDRIVVAVSGGKDSMLLLWLLRERLARAPIHYELVAVHVDPGFDAESAGRLEDFFRREGFRWEIVHTDHGPRAHGPENRENPCFLCSRLRRVELFKKANELHCGKLALGHNQDDFLETFFISVCYGAQVSTMLPRQEFFQGAVTVIRPLALVPSAKVDRLGRKLGLPVIPTCCPSAEHNKRKEMRTFLQELCARNPKVRGNIYHALSHVNLDYLPAPLEAPAGCSNLREYLKKEGGVPEDHGA